VVGADGRVERARTGQAQMYHEIEPSRFAAPSSHEMIDGIEAHEAGDDEIKRDHIIQKAR